MPKTESLDGRNTSWWTCKICGEAGCRCPIRFKCPDCGARHNRGYFNSVGFFRCLKCGYLGRKGLELPKTEVPTAWDRLLEPER